jgi:hypothetical protein
MGTIKKGILTPPPEYWVHFRKFLRRKFWKTERKAGIKDINKRLKDGD